MELKDLHSPADIKKMSVDQLTHLATQLRGALMERLSLHGGHVGPNLGVVELTIALHYVFNSPVDKLIFDVSHQTYIHKMLTGRIDGYITSEGFEKISGYSNPAESPHDFFTLGHTSTSVSLASGLAKARDLKCEHHNIVAIIGDGSLSGGEAFEGLDYAAELGTNFIVVVNDNGMSIAENHGGLYDNLRQLRETDGQAPVNYFKSLGFDYHYVKEGNNIGALIEALSAVKDSDHPVVLHVSTQKGKGYAPAEADREHWHYGAAFDLQSGDPLHVSTAPDYGELTARHLLSKMEKDPLLAVITAGTPGVMGFTPELRRKAGRQFIDVGIAEEQAVALASGMAKAGARPVFGVYSTFIQRAYDQLSQDLAINNNPAVINVFLGSLYGMNDETHLGFFDIPFLSNIPNLVYLAPTCREEYFAMLDWAIDYTGHPVAIKVPGGPVVSSGRKFPTDYSDLNRFETVTRGSRVAIIGVGAFFGLAEQAAALLREKGIEPTIINPRFVSGLDTAMLDSLAEDHSLIITLEDGVLDGGFGEKVARYYGPTSVKVRCYGLRKEFLDRYNASEVARELHLTPDLLAADISAML